MKISRLFWIGFIFIFFSSAFIGGLLYLQDISLKKSNYVFTVLFENVQGLHMGDQVDMLGKKIGKVTQTRIKGQKIAVELSIDNLEILSNQALLSFFEIKSREVDMQYGLDNETFNWINERVKVASILPDGNQENVIIE